MKLDPDLKTEAAAALLDSLRAMEGQAVEIDASEVKVLGGSCAQALIAASESWRAAGQPFTIVNASEEFLADAATLAASEHINITGRVTA